MAVCSVVFSRRARTTGLSAALVATLALLVFSGRAEGTACSLSAFSFSA